MTLSEASNAKPSKSLLKRRGMMLVLSAPPGGGKTTISREILKKYPDAVVSVSYTTRDKRPGEVDGEHYHFVDPETFQLMIDNGEMLEYAMVYNRSLYGTPRAPVEKALNEGKVVIFDIDWQGHLKIKGTAENEKDVVSVFILPPDFESLDRRMHDRARDSEEDIQLRLKKAKDEMSHYKEFQYIVINSDIDEAVEKVKMIVEAERLKRRRLVNIEEFVETLHP